MSADDRVNIRSVRDLRVKTSLDLSQRMSDRHAHPRSSLHQLLLFYGWILKVEPYDAVGKSVPPEAPHCAMLAVRLQHRAVRDRPACRSIRGRWVGVCSRA